MSKVNQYLFFGTEDFVNPLSRFFECVDPYWYQFLLIVNRYVSFL